MASIYLTRLGPSVKVVRGHEYRYDRRTVYRVVYRVHLPSGPPVRKIREYPTKQLASKILSDASTLENKSQRDILTVEDVRFYRRLGLIGDREANLLLGRPVSMSWTQLVEKYEAYSTTRCRPGTHTKNLSKARMVRGALEPIIADPTAITIENIEEWIGQRKSPGAQHKTINNELDVLRRMLDPAFPEGQNPARRVRKLDVARMGRLPRALTLAEDAKILAVVWAHQKDLYGCLWPLYLVYRFAGLRRQEALVLPWTHVLEDRLLVQDVRLETNELSAGHRFAGNTWRPKEWEARAVPVPYMPAWAIKDLKSCRDDHRLLFAPRGTLLHPDVVSQAFDTVLGKIADDLTLHDLRHTFITALMEQAVPAAVVQRLAGHKHLATTERYTHVAVFNAKRDLESVRRFVVGRHGRVQMPSRAPRPTQ